MPLTVRPISREELLAFVASRPSASFLQCPSWAEVKVDWRAESLGWFAEDGKVVGAGLVLYRRLPALPRYLAYLPEGPLINWVEGDLGRWITPLLRHLRAAGAFTVKMGPPVVTRRWDATTVKGAIAGGTAARLSDVPPDVVEDAALRIARELRGSGWRQEPPSGAGFGDVQPRYVFQLPLAGRTPEDLLTGFNQQWRRNVKKAEKAGVVVSLGCYDDLPEFHQLYRVTAARDGFFPRPLVYFERMWRAMSAEDPDRLRLYLARHDGDLLAATTMVVVGEHAWYCYGASADIKRELRPSNAIQWRMICDALAAGAAVYDLRGISDTLCQEDPLFGLLQFKVGTGGRVVEYLGEWDFPVHRLLHKAFQLYLARR